MQNAINPVQRIGFGSARGGKAQGEHLFFEPSRIPADIDSLGRLLVRKAESLPAQDLSRGVMVIGNLRAIALPEKVLLRQFAGKIRKGVFAAVALVRDKGRHWGVKLSTESGAVLYINQSLERVLADLRRKLDFN